MEKDKTAEYEKAVKALDRAAEKVRKLGADVRVSINAKNV